MRRFLILFLGILAVGAIAFFLFFQKENPEKKSFLPIFSGQKTFFGKKISAPDDLAPPPDHHSILTGLPRENPENPEKILAVMIEESVAARGNYRGISAAKILFEMPAEGGIPRFAAIFSGDDAPAEIGPVRSARDYFLKMIAPIAPAIVHAGGSPAAFSFLKTSKIRDLNRKSETDDRFFRDQNLFPPHNLFVVFSKIKNEIPEISGQKPVFHFSKKIPDGPTAAAIQIDFSSENHRVDYTFDADKKCFHRAQKFEKTKMCFENIAVIETQIALIDGDEKGRLAVKTTGDGAATIFRDGRKITGKWRRKKDQKIEFFDADGDPIFFRPGKTIVEIIDRPEKLRTQTFF